MEVLGDYIIRKELGQGVFGTVYLAEHRFIKKMYALKVLPESVALDPTFIRRFEAHVSLVAKLDHPHIVKIHNVSYADGVYFLVMDPVVDSLEESMNLGRFLDLKGKFLSESEIEEIAKTIASALDYAHEAGVVHGGLKLSNLFVMSEGNGIKVVLSDFGITQFIGEGISFLKICESIAKSLSEYSLEKAKEFSRSFVQSFAFLAPEQKTTGPSSLENSVDTYAFGVLLYILCLRKLPEGAFELPSKMHPEFQKNWDLLIQKCLAPSPSLRPQKLQFALQHDLDQPKEVPAPQVHISEVEKSIENINQMAFEFPQAGKLPAPPSVEPSVKPVLKPQEITRPEYDSDPAAIFQRDTLVSHYTPRKVEEKEIEPILTEMAVISGGSYMRGSSEGARDELPRHSVFLSDFALDIHPVTNEQFVRFLLAMGGEKDQNNNDIIRLRDARIKRSAGKLLIESGYAKHPVVGVTWYGALAFAKWVGKRLPTEAEWEIASLGGQPGILYPTGIDIEKTQANFFSSDTTPVMSYPPNVYGLFDMAGNVYEWCQDWYAYNYYETSSLEPQDPMGPPQGVYRVLRGGCWKSLKDDLRCSHRHRNNPGAVNGTYGFRCAADVS
jgi:formylglycine-generating enzyme required for sulfatase activity/tRNA A-37 threonylcarbamoyl transferase component Bud32